MSRNATTTDTARPRYYVTDATGCVLAGPFAAERYARAAGECITAARGAATYARRGVLGAFDAAPSDAERC